MLVFLDKKLSEIVSNLASDHKISEKDVLLDALKLYKRLAESRKNDPAARLYIDSKSGHEELDCLLSLRAAASVIEFDGAKKHAAKKQRQSEAF